MQQGKIQLVRYSEENPNIEALKGKYGSIGEEWGCVVAVKNMLNVIAYRGAKVSGYVLPDVYDGFLICSDGSTVQVENSVLTLDLAEGVSAQGMLKLKKDN